MEDQTIDTIRIPTIAGNKTLQKQLASEMAPIKTIEMLTDKEELFCQLFCNGGKEYAGNPAEAYKQVFGVRESKRMLIEANELLNSPAVSERIREIINKKMEMESYRKMRVLETLYAIMDECRDARYKDKWGVDLSPAPLRAVAVNAAKAIGELSGFKPNDSTGVTLNGENNVTFNVIVPSKHG